MKKLLSLFSVMALVLSACSPVDNPEKRAQHPKRDVDPDPHSYANIDEIQTRHLHLELDVNFDNQTIYGVARHQMGEHTCDTAIFDIKNLEIKRVTLGKAEEKSTDFVIGAHDELLGAPLKVKIDSGTEYVNIYYQTTQKTEALDWLPAELTEGKKSPFLYTQGQAILTRSWIPIQGTPKNRITYSADVKVPADLLAIMSASNPVKKNKTGVYHFEMKQQIPAYLIALAVGDLTYTALGPNCGVYSEPALAEACANEFVDIPKMIATAENLYGAYQWEQYDIVMLPYSFPFGGMENPRLTFANPTLLAGDRSMVSVIAHELAHSWSGNLVTNATWNDFWLNEGFTVYFENRIMEQLYGKEISDILAIIEFQDLELALENIENGEHPEDSQLKLRLENRNPDDGMTDVAYNKGAYFLRTLENAVGREQFDTFLKNYFHRHAFQTITTEDFVEYVNEELLAPENVTFNLDEWIYQPGLPENCVRITSDRLANMERWAQEINEGTFAFNGSFSKVKRADYITQEWLTFIRKLHPSISAKTMATIDKQLHFSSEGNAMLKSDWYQLAVKSGYNEIRPEMAAFLKKIGRRWFIEPIYQTLRDSQSPEDLAWAKEVFEEAKNNYHFVSRSTVQAILYE